MVARGAPAMPGQRQALLWPSTLMPPRVVKRIFPTPAHGLGDKRARLEGTELRSSTHVCADQWLPWPWSAQQACGRRGSGNRERSLTTPPPPPHPRPPHWSAARLSFPPEDVAFLPPPRGLAKISLRKKREFFMLNVDLALCACTRVLAQACVCEPVCVCLLNGIFSLVKFLSNYVAKFTSVSQSSFWFHSQPWASLM